MTLMTAYKDKELPSYTEFFNSLIAETTSADASETSSKIITKSNKLITLEDEDATENNNANQSPIEKIYPHIFDEDTETGQSLKYIGNALNDAQLALDAFDDTDFQTINTRITQVAVALHKAYPLTTFNESLGIVISFIRRAILAASVYNISRASLNILIHALQAIISNPMIDLDDASDLVDKLSDGGWNGEHHIAYQLITTLLSDYDLNDSEVETLLSQLVED